MKNLLVSPSQLDLSSCMTKYHYERLVNAAPTAARPYLEEGDLMHYMLADYYRESAKSGDVRLPFANRVEKAIDVGRAKVINMDLDIHLSEDVVVKTFREYCEYWRNDHFSIHMIKQVKEDKTEIYVPAIEQVVVRTIYERPETEEDEGLRVVIQLIVDTIFEDPQGSILWTDHKTRSRNREAIPMLNQFIAYAFLSGNGKSMRNNIGFQKTLPPEKKFTRDPFHYNRAMLEWWKGWTVYQAQYIDACIEGEHFPPNFMMCDRYDGCAFRDVCMQAPEDRERFLNENFKARKRIGTIYEVVK